MGIQLASLEGRKKLVVCWSRRKEGGLKDGGFLNLVSIDILGQVIVCGWGYPVHCGIFSSSSGLYQPEAIGILSSCL